MTDNGSAGRLVAALVHEGIVAADRADDAQKTVEAFLASSPPDSSAVSSPVMDPRVMNPRVMEADAVSTAGLPTQVRTHRPRLAEVAAYAGAALVVASMVLLGLQYWAQWQPLQRSLVIGSVSLVLLAAALVAWRLSRTDEPASSARTRYVIATLVLVSAIAMAIAVGSYLYTTRYRAPVYDRHNVSLTVALVIALLILALGYLLVRTMLVQLGLAVAAFTLTTSVWLGEQYSSEDWLPGLWRAVLILVLAALWGVLAETRRWREESLGRAVTAVLLIAGCQMMFGLPSLGWAHAFTLAAAFVLFGLYWWRGDWPHLAGGVVALTIAVTEALVEWTHGSLGAGGAVLVAGLTLLAASGGAVLLRRRREADTDVPPAPRPRFRHRTG